MEVEALQQSLPNSLSGPVRLDEQVVGRHHTGTPIRFHDRHDVLEEIQLLVGRCELEIFTLVVFAFGVDRDILTDNPVARLLAERRVGNQDVNTLAGIAGKGVGLL